MALAHMSPMQRLAVVLAASEVLATEVEILALASAIMGAPERPRVRALRRNFELTMAATERVFRQDFRVGRSVFRYLVERIAELPDFATVPRNVGARAVPVSKLVAIFLYRFGKSGRGYGETSTWFDVGCSTVQMATVSVIRALIAAFPTVIDMQRAGPQKDAEMAAFTRDGWFGCRGIIDATHVKVVPPTSMTRSGNADSFTNRDNTHTQVYQVICDSRLRVLNIYGGNGGKTSDQVLLYESQFYKELGQFLAEGEWIMADMGYALRAWCISGFRTPEIGALPQFAGERAFFNKLFSGKRITIERLFGVLKARFGALLYGLFFRERAYYSLVFRALCIVHNICVDMRDVVDEAEVRVAMARERAARHVRRVAVPAEPAEHAATLAAGQAKRAAIAARVGATVQ